MVRRACCPSVLAKEDSPVKGVPEEEEDEEEGDDKREDDDDETEEGGYSE
jgi:hypothetical protein